MTVDVISPYLTSNEAAAYLRISAQCLRRHRLNGTGPRFFRRNQNMIRYTKADLDAWLSGDDAVTA